MKEEKWVIIKNRNLAIMKKNTKKLIINRVVINLGTSHGTIEVTHGGRVLISLGFIKKWTLLLVET
jgi:hypothetical protein